VGDCIIAVCAQLLGAFSCDQNGRDEANNGIHHEYLIELNSTVHRKVVNWSREKNREKNRKLSIDNDNSYYYN